jgi:hypothetical protein
MPFAWNPMAMTSNLKTYDKFYLGIYYMQVTCLLYVKYMFQLDLAISIVIKPPLQLLVIT